jgi:predicted dehydrogenase
MQNLSRRNFIKSMAATAAVIGFPSIIPSHVLGKTAPSNTIQIGQIGFGRIAKSMDVPGILGCSGVRIVAISDVDVKRMEYGRAHIARAFPHLSTPEIQLYQDYHEMLGRSDIDAVSISTPDHWHSQPAVEAAFAGKDIFMQKPASLTIAEGRLVSNAIRENKRVFLLGSQQRSTGEFRRACELVRNGRLGRIKAIEIGLPGDPSGGRTQEMPVPAHLNYDMWLGSTPLVYYTEDRVHSVDAAKIDSRPGWLRCEQFGAGMITGWGSHHVDIAHWAMGWEATGPVSVEGKGFFPKEGLWNVHGEYDVNLTYADGTPMRIWDKYPNGIRFIGEKGWIFVSRGAARMTASDPASAGKSLKALDASDPKLLQGVIGENEIQLYKPSSSHHQNWIDCIRSREATIVPAETAHRTCSACLVAHIGMRLGRKLQWDPAAERFVGDQEANALLSRTERAPYGTRRAYEKLSKKSLS